MSAEHTEFRAGFIGSEFIPKNSYLEQFIGKAQELYLQGFEPDVVLWDENNHYYFGFSPEKSTEFTALYEFGAEDEHGKTDPDFDIQVLDSLVAVVIPEKLPQKSQTVSFVIPRQYLDICDQLGVKGHYYDEYHQLADQPESAELPHVEIPVESDREEPGIGPGEREGDEPIPEELGSGDADQEALDLISDLADIFAPMIADLKIQDLVEIDLPQLILEKLRTLAHWRDQKGLETLTGQLEVHRTAADGNFLVLHFPGYGKYEQTFKIARLEMGPDQLTGFTGMLTSLGVINRDESETIIQKFNQSRELIAAVDELLIRSLLDLCQKQPETPLMPFLYVNKQGKLQRMNRLVAHERVKLMVDAVLRFGGEMRSDWKWAEGENKFHIFSVFLDTNQDPVILTPGAKAKTSVIPGSRRDGPVSYEILRIAYPAALDDAAYDIKTGSPVVADELVSDMSAGLHTIGLLTDEQINKIVDTYQLIYKYDNGTPSAEAKRREFFQANLRQLDISDYKPLYTEDGKWQYTIQNVAAYARGYAPNVLLGTDNGVSVLTVCLPDQVSNSVHKRLLVVRNRNSITYNLLHQALERKHSGLIRFYNRGIKFELVRYTDGRLGVAFMTKPEKFNTLVRSHLDQYVLLFGEAINELLICN